jgi:hypothetical protein
MTLENHVMSLFALAVSIVGAALLRDTPRDQARVGAQIFGGLVGGAVLLGWLLYAFPL